MPLDRVDVEERKLAGHDAAYERTATEHKPFGQTSETVYPYTYWWVVGFNEAVDEINKKE
jgi:hypothetical protein